MIHHTDCGMETFTDGMMRGLLAQSLKPATVDASGWHDIDAGPGSTAAEFISFLTISDVQQSVVDDVQRTRAHALVPRDIPISGSIYDVQRGRLAEVAEATRSRRRRVGVRLRSR